MKDASLKFESVLQVFLDFLSVEKGLSLNTVLHQYQSGLRLLVRLGGLVLLLVAFLPEWHGLPRLLR